MAYKEYIVGGAVRDRLLGLPTKDRDWVVVGATPHEILEKGFKPVGKNFPVFLHPQTREEYALARTEKKQGKGYHGFTFYSSPEVSLEDDLLRRDITINAMAEDKEGNIFDPYGGQEDIKNRVIRHTSQAFVEDPLRVLRVARFTAQFHKLGFTLDKTTKSLLVKMVDELDDLSAERIWVETAKALSCEDPQVYFNILREAGALGYWFPELERLYGVPQPLKYHPEGDCFVHTMLVLKQASLLGEDIGLRFSALVHDLGKGLTPPDILPSHHGHEERGVAEVEKLCSRLLVPHAIKRLAVLCCRYHTHSHKCHEMRPQTIVKVFDAFDLWRRPDAFASYLLLCKADSRGRLGKEDSEYRRGDYFARIASAATSIDIQGVIKGVEQDKIQVAVKEARIKAVRDFIDANPPDYLE